MNIIPLFLVFDSVQSPKQSSDKLKNNFLQEIYLGINAIGRIL